MTTLAGAVGMSDSADGIGAKEITTTIGGVSGIGGIVLGTAPRFARPRALVIPGDSLVVSDANAILMLRPLAAAAHHTPAASPTDIAQQGANAALDLVGVDELGRAIGDCAGAPSQLRSAHDFGVGIGGVEAGEQELGSMCARLERQLEQCLEVLVGVLHGMSIARGRGRALPPSVDW
jgi:hypothetical protein